MLDSLTGQILPAARWSRRLALFSSALLALVVLLHRFGALTTPVALNAFAVALGGAVVSVLLAFFALVVIWRGGRDGAAAASVGLLVGLFMLGWPLAYILLTKNLPHISDISTDAASPPRFQALAKRQPGMNSTAPPDQAAGEARLKAYPDVRTFIMDRPVEEAFEFVEEAARRLKWKVAASDPPVSRPARAGTLEAVEQTPIIGFVDDVVVRVEGSANRARVDVRSSSRYGAFDFGQNASRVRKFLAELQARVEAAGPNGGAHRSLRTTRSGAMVKKGKADDPPKGALPNAKDRAQSNAQRERVQRETQR